MTSAAIVTAGVVHSLKHSYGFVRCDQTGDRIFFHFSEISPDSLAAARDLPADEPPVQIGDRVEFQRARDQQSGREKAVAVRVIARANGHGVSPKSSSGITDSSSNTAKINGVQAYPRPVSYPHSMQPSPETPDGVADNREKCGVHDDNTKREMGVIVSTKHSYGFIKCAERDHKQIFFHFSELVGSDPSVLKPGVEVEFTVSPNKNGKVVATRLRLLPAGAVQFAMVESDTITGVIKSGVMSANSTSQKTRKKARPSSMDIGSLVVPSEELTRTGIIDPDDRRDHERTLTFSGADLKFPGIALMEGDEVQFRVKTDRRTHARTATEVLLVRPCPTGRVRGVVTIWKELYGFLKCDGRKDHLFFHLNEFIDKTHHPQVGDCLEFNIAPDNRGQDNAVRVSVLPKGAVVLKDDRIFGVILSCPPAASSVPSSVPTSRRTHSDMSTISNSGLTTAPSYGLIRIFPIQDSSGSPVSMTEEQLATLKPLPTDMNTSTTGVTPIVEEFSAASSPATSPKHMKSASSVSSWRPNDVVEENSSYMDNVRFTIADNTSTLRRGDIVSLAVAPAPKFLRASNIRMVPKVGVVGEVGSAHATLRVEATAFAPQEELTLRLHDLPFDFNGQLKRDDVLEILEISSGTGRQRYAKAVRKLQGSSSVFSKLKSLVSELNTSYQEPEPVSVSSPSHHHDKSKEFEKDSPVMGRRRWDSRLEPRNWS